MTTTEIPNASHSMNLSGNEPSNVTPDIPLTPTPEPQQKQQQEAWYGTIEDQSLKEWADNKNFASPQEALKSYNKLEKFMGADKAGRGVIVPKEDSSTEEWESFYDKIGRPQDARGYDLPVPEGVSYDFADAMSQIMYDSGIPKQAAQNLAEAWNQYTEKMKASQQEQQDHDFLQQDATLKREWGGAYEANIADAGIAARNLGIDGEQVDALQQALGYDGVMKLFYGINQKIGDPSFIQGARVIDESKDSMTPEQAENRWQELLRDKDFFNKIMAGDPKAMAIKSNISKYRNI